MLHFLSLVGIIEYNTFIIEHLGTMKVVIYMFLLTHTIHALNAHDHFTCLTLFIVYVLKTKLNLKNVDI